MSELKPCPFCGSDAKVEDHGSFKIVGCSKLSMLCPNPRITVYNNDFSWWNARSSDNQLTTITKQRDDLVESLSKLAVDFLSFKAWENRVSESKALLSTIKEQKDAE